MSHFDEQPDGNPHGECALEIHTPQAQLAERDKEIADLKRQVLEQQANGSVYGVIDPDYGRVFSIARAIAWQEGYSICAQGSFTRDLDLLATPWTDHARKDVDVLVRRIAHAADLNIQGEPSDKPHGRKAWTLLFKTFGDPRFVDISVMQPSSALESALKAERLAGKIEGLEEAKEALLKNIVPVGYTYEAGRYWESSTSAAVGQLRRMAAELKEGK